MIFGQVCKVKVVIKSAYELSHLGFEPSSSVICNDKGEIRSKKKKGGGSQVPKSEPCHHYFLYKYCRTASWSTGDVVMPNGHFSSEPDLDVNLND